MHCDFCRKVEAACEQFGGKRRCSGGRNILIALFFTLASFTKECAGCGTTLYCVAKISETSLEEAARR